MATVSTAHTPGRLVLFLTGFVCLCTAGFGRAQAPKLPPDLDLVPRDAAGFIHIQTAAVWKSEWLVDVRHVFERAGPPTLQTLLKRFAPDLSTVDRLTFVMPSPATIGQLMPDGEPEGLSALLIVHTVKPYDRASLIEAMGPRQKLYKKNPYYFNEDMWSGLALIDDQTLVLGSEDALVRFFDGRGNRADGPLQAALLQTLAGHHVVVGINPALLAKDAMAKALPAPMQGLLGAKCATLALDLDKETKLAVRLDYAGEEEAKAGETALKGTLEFLRVFLATGIADLEKKLKAPRESGGLGDLPESVQQVLALGFLREIDDVLKAAPVERAAATVQTHLKYKGVQPTLLAAAGTMAFGVKANQRFLTVGEFLTAPGQPDPYEDYFKKLTAALDKYYKDKGTYPPAATYDKEGRPLLSWRVSLLPYLGEEALYKEFKLEEPWDSLHNKKLLKRRPDAFAIGAFPKYRTRTLVFTGPGTFFPGKNGAKKGDVPAAAALLAQVNGERAVFWSKPSDLAYAPDQPLPQLFGPYGMLSVKIFRADGKLESFGKSTLNEKVLRGLITGK
jgi:Protein of unknown function (DUF1559)